MPSLESTLRECKDRGYGMSIFLLSNGDAYVHRVNNPNISHTLTLDQLVPYIRKNILGYKV